MKTTTKNKIKELIQNKYDLKDLLPEDIEMLFYDIENLKGAPMLFSVYVRTSLNGTDTWLQAEYYSDKLCKTIIWDYDYPSKYDTADDLIEFIEATNDDIKAFENRLNDVTSDIVARLN